VSIVDPANRHAAEAARVLNTAEFQLVEAFIGRLAPRAVEDLRTRQAKAWEIASALAKTGFTAYDMDECNAVTNVEALAEQYGLSPSGAAEAYATAWAWIGPGYGPDFQTKAAYVVFEAVRDAR
jgi:hypothetical protein